MGQSLGVQVETFNYSLASPNSFLITICLCHHASDSCTHKNSSQYTLRKAVILICKEFQVAVVSLWFLLTSFSVRILQKAKRIPGRTVEGCDAFELEEIGLVGKNMKTILVRNW